MSGPGNGPASGVDPFEHDDASYLLGMLTSAERAAFEAHLTGCAACMARVAALRPVTGGLAAGGDEIRDALARSMDPAAGPASARPGDRVTGLVQLVERRRRRTRWVFGGLATAAAAAIVALTVALAAPAGSSPTVAAAPMTATGAAAIRATAAITAAPWGSEITVDCRYSGSSQYPSGDIYTLQIVDRSGQTQEIGSWTLGQGAQVRFVGGTALALGQIRAVNVIRPDGAVVLRLAV